MDELERASVLVVGAGAIGAAVVAQLAAAGAGRLGIVDPKGAEAGMGLAEAAATGAGALNPAAIAEPYPARLEEANLEAILTGHDVTIDCSNDDAVHALLSDRCAFASQPLALGGASGLAGWATTISRGSPCYRCARPPRTAEPAAGPAAAAIGAVLAAEALKLSGQVGEPLTGKLLRIDLHTGTAGVDAVERRRGCPACASAAVEATL